MSGKARTARDVAREMRSGARDWISGRMRMGGVFSFLEHKIVPLHRHTSWYYWGNILLTFFGIQALTGVALLFYYRPTPDTAYESISAIVLDTRYGWWIRSVHAWSANLMVGAAFVHLFSVFFLKSYRRPRELTWLSGMGMFFVILGFGFSGYLLPWNELSFFATKVGTGIAETTPLIGHALKIFLRGGEEVGAASLTRFFALHVAVLPSAILALLTLHLFLIQVHGMSVPPKLEDQPVVGRPFFPDFVLREAAIACLIVALVVGLAGLFPWEVGYKADPMKPTPTNIHPEWYFLFMYKALQWIPSKVGPWDGGTMGVMLFAAMFAVLVGIPFFDRADARGRGGRAWRVAGAAFIAFLLITTALAVEGESGSSAPSRIRSASVTSSQEASRASDSSASAPSPSVDEQLRRFARDNVPSVIFVLVLALSTSYFLWSKARDADKLRRLGYFAD